MVSSLVSPPPKDAGPQPLCPPLTSNLLKVPSPDKGTLGLGLLHMNLRGTQTLSPEQLQPTIIIYFLKSLRRGITCKA